MTTMNGCCEMLDESQMCALMVRLAPLLRGGAVIYLEGDLGAGKTTVARALIQALGYPHRVKSPTYSLLEQYELDDLTVCHLDLYRLAEAREVSDLGLEEMTAVELTDGASQRPSQRPCLMLVEWPDRGGAYLPRADLHIRLRVQGDGRALEMLAASPRGETVLHAWKQL